MPTNRLAVYQDLRFQYDLHGNIVERRIGWHTVQRFRYSAEHQMLESTVTRYHDRPEPKIAGSNTQPEPAATVQTTRYRYDALGRRIDKHDAFGRTTFLYDGDPARRRKSRGSRLSEYLYEPDSFVPLAQVQSLWSKDQQACDKALGNPFVQQSLHEARNDDKVLEHQGPAAAAPKLQSRLKGVVPQEAPLKALQSQALHVHTDHLGTPRELTNADGDIVWATTLQGLGCYGQH